MGRFRLRGRSRRSREPRADRVPFRALVPNLVTSMAACAGITSISLSSEGRFVHALVALLVACVCDGMDGRIARLLHASSKLGAELDSLADFVNFGVAPAMFMFFWLTGRYFGSGDVLVSDPRLVRVILGCALFYAMCDCFRLARFNTMLEQPSQPYWKHFFTGVPAPGGCWMVLTPAILTTAFDAKDLCPGMRVLFQNPFFGMFMLLFVGSLMASRLPTISLKSLRVPRQHMLAVYAGLLLLISAFFANFWMTMGFLGVGYLMTVPVTCWAFARVRARYCRDANQQIRP
ncbi:MAG: phosphatidylcholine/phosphatidylserine synthase [Kiritimatiellae bacterium]|nr:phosphatidylcholine/phosphatidylserine synthase [Kiritimatiellia bacterium]